MSYQSRISRSFDSAPVLPLDHSSRYVLFSDCHRGSANSNDNFLRNQHLYFSALWHYYQNGFTYIELGDGDELWENTRMEQIIEVHNNIFWLFRKYAEENRLYLLYGNHDIEKKKASYSNQHCSTFFCTDCQQIKPLFPDLNYYSGLILKDTNGPGIYLTHGHQADLLNSVFWRLSRFLVRYVWKPLEHIGVTDPTSAARNNHRKNATEKRLISWAEDRRQILITGHTHRPRLNGTDPYYFNTGSCVHPRCITCIEIQNRTLTLCKWAVDTRSDGTLYVAREELAEPISLSRYEL
ncbi:MAG: serine/threonine protein phosphatase [Eubacteriales bacterium]|nr:serine/threonine protein phosphatase [Eubacteriales bacterium]